MGRFNYSEVTVSKLFKNKSEDQTKFLCDSCGKNPDNELWESDLFEGQYCLKHFRESHDDIDGFDNWYKIFGDLRFDDNED